MWLHFSFKDKNFCINCGLNKDPKPIGNGEILCYVCKTDYQRHEEIMDQSEAEWGWFLPSGPPNSTPLIMPSVKWPRCGVFLPKNRVFENSAAFLRYRFFDVTKVCTVILGVIMMQNGNVF